MKRLRGQRTYIVFGLIVLASLADLLPGVKEYLPANWYAWLAFASAFAGIVMRTVTTTPPRIPWRK